MNAVFSVARLTRKARKMALAWGLVALAAPNVFQTQLAHAQSGMVPPGPDQGVEQAGFDFVNEQPTRRFANPNGTPRWDDSDEGAGGFGLEARIGQKVGNTIGRDKDITHTELMPYIISGDQMVFGSLRMFRASNANLGGSAGLGYRFFAEDWNKVLGINSYYDRDDHRGVTFEQVGLGLEILGDTWDARANWYVPNGTLTQVLGVSAVAGSQNFSGNDLLFDRRTDIAAAANGFDVMITTPVPGGWSEKHDLEASAGFYHYYSRDVDTDSIWGYRLRADAGFFQDLAHMFLEYTSDKQTEHAVMFGVSLDWHGGINTVRRRGGSQKNRLGEFVRRNDHVVTLDQPIIEEDVVAINDDTGLPFNIVHVDRARDETAVFDPTSSFLPLGGAPDDGVGDGTFENPFLSIEDAFASDPALDIVFVGGGPLNVYSDVDFLAPLVIGDDQSLLGEATGVDHLVNVQGITDPVLLPSPTASLLAATDPPLTRPVLQGLLGTAVTLSDNSEFSGFIIDGASLGDPTIINTVNGVSGNAVTDGTIQDVTVTNVSGNGIELIDTTGSFDFENIQIGALAGGVISQAGPDGIVGTADDAPDAQGADGVGFLVSGGSPIVNFLGLSSPLSPTGNHIANDTGGAVQILNTTGGSVGLGNVNIVDDGGDGILILETAGRVTLGLASLSNTTGSSISILDSSGTTDLLDTITIFNAGDDAFVINDLNPGGQVNGGLDSVINITQIGAIADAVGLQLNRINGAVTLGGSLNIGSAGALANLTQPAINFQNSAGDVRIATLAIDQRAGAGINIGDDDIAVEGIFDPTGMLSLNSPDEDANPNETNSLTASFTLTADATFDQVGSPDLPPPPGVLFNRGNANIQMLNDFSTFSASQDIQITERGGVGIRIEGLQPGARASFGSVDIDDGGSDDEGAAIRIINNHAPVSFNVVQIDGTDDADYIVEIDSNNRLDAGDPLTTAGVTIRDLNILNADLGGARGDSVLEPIDLVFGGFANRTFTTIAGGRVPSSALVITNNDRVVISDGVIEVEEGRAITAINNLTTLDADAAGDRFLRFERIDVDGGTDFGVFLFRNRGDFEITGVRDAAGTGGTIDSVGVGLGFYDHDGDVILTGVEVNDVRFGVHINNQWADEHFDPRGLATLRDQATGLPVTVDQFGNTLDGILLDDTDFELFSNVITRAFLDTLEITEGAGALPQAGLRMTNVDTILVDNTVVDEFVLAGAIFDIDTLNVDDIRNLEDLTYDWQIVNSSFTDIFDVDAVIGLNGVQGTTIFIQSAAGNDDETTLNLTIDSNVLDSGGQTTNALFVDWDGGVNAQVTNNAITGGDSVDDGQAAMIDFEIGDDENVSNILISTNTINDTDVDSIGVRVEADGEVNLDIENNIFQFALLDAIGVELDLNFPDSDVQIDANQFIFQQDQATVVFVDGIVGPSSFEFSDNAITFNALTNNILNPNTVLEFQGITNTVALDGDNNTATPITPFTILLTPQNSGSFTGSVEINGQFLQ